MSTSLDALTTRLDRLEHRVSGIQAQGVAINQIGPLSFLTRSEWKKENVRLTSSITFVGQRLDNIEKQLSASVFPTLTSQEAESLVQGAQVVASVQSDFRRVFTEFEKTKAEIQQILYGEGRSLATRIATLETGFKELENQTAAMTQLYDETVASVNAVKRGYLTANGIITINSPSGWVHVPLEGYPSSTQWSLTTSLENGGNPGVQVYHETKDEAFELYVKDTAGNAVDCTSTNEVVHWRADKQL